MSMSPTDRLEMARQARASGGSIKKIEELKSAVSKRLAAAEMASVEDRLSQMPKTAIRTYLMAMRGRSKQSAIRAMCQMCLGWDDFRAGIRNCTDPACPLFQYRPYRKG